MTSGGLPSHHVARPRLTDPLRTAVGPVVVEAAAGYGKSVLAAELVAQWECVPVVVVLEEGPVSAKLLAGRLRAAVARAGFAAAADAMSSAGEDVVGAVDAMLDGLRGEAFALVIDDVHQAARDAAGLIDRIAHGVASPGRLVVLGRQLPEGAERLRRAEFVHLGADDLSLRADEALAVCREGFGLDASSEDARALLEATGGWTAAAVLAAARAKRTEQRVQDVAGVTASSGDPRAPVSSPVAAILDEALAALGPAGAQLALLAALPLLDREVVAIVTGEPKLFDTALALGLPLTPAGDRWWELPGPVRDHLASLAVAETEALVRAAGYYQANGQLGSALQMLLAAGHGEAAARLLGGDLDPTSLEALDVLELIGLYERLPPASVSAVPRATFQVARMCGMASLLERRARLLQQLREQVDEGGDAPLRHAIDAEIAIDMVNAAKPLESEELGRRVLAAAGPGEELTQARALTAIGFGLCAHRGDDGRLSEAALAEAATVFDQAISIYRGTGARAWVSGVAAPRAIWTELGLGRGEVALGVLDAAIVDCAAYPRRVGRLYVHRAQVLSELGRFDEAEDTLTEVARIGERIDPLLVAFAAWGRMTIASYRGDADEVARNAHLVEASRGDWWLAVGSEFLAEAADCHDRAGHPGPAREFLRRALAEPNGENRWTAIAQCALEARHGDPLHAEALLAGVYGRGIFPKEYWRVGLLRAYAVWRRGDRAAGSLAAAAFDEAARLGQPDAPLIRERELAVALLALAAETGSLAAQRLERHDLPLALAVLGRFELSRGGRRVDLGSGQAAQLLKLVAVSGGRIPVERAIEALWPDADPDAGRNRLRTVLGRLREAAPETVSRDGDVLALGAEVRLDLAEFERESRQARALGDGDAAVSLATSAISRYRGELLPDDPYEDWADGPREAARQSVLDLLDLCAEAAARRGDLDEARRFVERTIELAPYEDDRYLRVAAILNDQGRRGAALSVIRRARSTLETLGLELPPQLLELRDAITSPKRAAPVTLQ